MGTEEGKKQAENLEMETRPDPGKEKGSTEGWLGRF